MDDPRPRPTVVAVSTVRHTQARQPRVRWGIAEILLDRAGSSLSRLCFAKEMGSRRAWHPIAKVPSRREGLRRCADPVRRPRANLTASPDVRILLIFLNSTSDRNRKEEMSSHNDSLVAAGRR